MSRFPELTPLPGRGYADVSHSGAATVESPRRYRWGPPPRTATAVAEDQTLYAVFGIDKDRTKPDSKASAAMIMVGPRELEILLRDLQAQQKVVNMPGQLPMLVGYDQAERPHAIVVQLRQEDGSPHPKRDTSFFQALDSLPMYNRWQREHYFDRAVEAEAGEKVIETILPAKAIRLGLSDPIRHQPRPGFGRGPLGDTRTI